MELSRLYPAARVVELGDAGGGYRAASVPDILAQWGATQRLRQDRIYQSVDSARFNFEALYLLAARAAPRVRFSQYNNVEDQTQLGFLRLLGIHDVPLRDLLRENLAEIQQSNPLFRSYTAPGGTHTILTRPEFYTLRVDEIAIRDWVATLLDGGAVNDVGGSLLGKSAR